MKCLVLFYSQSEAGAPQYLSRVGGLGAESLAQTLHSFLQESFKIDFKEKFVERSNSLNLNENWKNFKNKESFFSATKESCDLFPQVLLLAGNENRTLKTAGYLGQTFALPICIHESLDKHSESKPFIGSLSQELPKILNQLEKYCPAVIIIGTSLPSLLEWIQTKTEKINYEIFNKVFQASSENDTIPAVFIAGYEKMGENENWIFDVPEEV